MKKLIVLAVASLFATSAMAGEMKWSGSAGWRYETKTQNDSLSSKNNTASSAQFGKDVSEYKTKAHAMRAAIGVNGGWENVEYGLGIRTGQAINSDWVNVTSGTDGAIGLETAWFRYMRDFGSVDFNLTVGRQMNVFAYDKKSENFFDNDVRLDGFGWQFKFGMFGLNLGQYVLGGQTNGTVAAGRTATSSSISYTEGSQATVGSEKSFRTLIGFQPYMNWKFSDEIETMFAVGYFHWNDATSNNFTSGGVDTSTLGNTAGTVPAIASVNYKVHNPKQWQFFNTWTLPYNLTFSAEYVMANKANYDNSHIAGYPGSGIPTPEASKSAWAAGLTYGAVKKAHDWSVSYYYGDKGLASVINTYTNSSFKADNKGHTFKANYAIADNFNLGWKGIWIAEKGKINANGGSATGNTYANANSAQEMKTKYMEFTAGVSF